MGGRQRCKPCCRLRFVAFVEFLDRFWRAPACEQGFVEALVERGAFGPGRVGIEEGAILRSLAEANAQPHPLDQLAAGGVGYLVAEGTALRSVVGAESVGGILDQSCVGCRERRRAHQGDSGVELSDARCFHGCNSRDGDRRRLRGQCGRGRRCNRRGCRLSCRCRGRCANAARSLRRRCVGFCQGCRSGRSRGRERLRDRRLSNRPCRQRQGD